MTHDLTRRKFIQACSGTAISLLTWRRAHAQDESLFTASDFTPANGFTRGVEGPACDREGNLYAVNFQKQGTIGKVTPAGECSIFVTLPGNSVGNGIRFNQRGDMFIADYVNHNVFKVDMATRQIKVHAHEPKMNQPNDLAIGGDQVLYASDPNWTLGSGQVWRIDPDGKTTLLLENMGTTNGIEVSPDDKTLYVAQSRERNIFAFDITDEHTLTNKRLHIGFETFGLDGMRCDVEGNLYATRIGNGTIAVISPAGKVLRSVQLKGKSCSNIAFGGPDGRTCYTTMADRCNIETFRSDRPGLAWKRHHPH